MNKIIFEQQQNDEIREQYQSKREFVGDDIHIEAEQDNLEEKLLNDKFDQVISAKFCWWKKVCGATLILFVIATVAQSLQWLIDSYQQHQWIDFAFALVGIVFVVLGLLALGNEWKSLYGLKKRERWKQQSQKFVEQDNSRVFTQDFEQGKQLCLDIADRLQLGAISENVQRWRGQINEAHNAQEVLYLFSQNVLVPLDQQVKKLINRSAVDSALIVAISPLALVDMFFVVWRNLRLVNQIAKLYGIELGYFSRIRLLRLVLLNMAFVGSMELLQDLGLDWLSQDFAAKLSARVAQGIGVGLLTARLGIKAMEFCRPLAFRQTERPRLNTIYRELLASVKNTLLSKNILI